MREREERCRGNVSDDEGGGGKRRGVWRVPLHASRWSARAQKSLFLPLSRFRSLFPRFAANSFFPSLSPCFFFSSRRPPSSSSCSFAARFYEFSVLQKVPVLLSVRRCFSSFYHHVLRSTTRDRRCGLILKISLSLLGFLTDLASASRRDRFRISRACHSSALRDYNDAPPTATTCRHDNTKSIGRSLHS